MIFLNGSRILLAHRNPALLARLAQELNRRHIYAQILQAQTGAALIQSQCFQPARVILVDMTFPCIERIMEYLSDDRSHPHIFACASRENGQPPLDTEKLGVHGWFADKISAQAICDRLEQDLRSAQPNGAQTRSGLRRRDAIHRMLYDAGLSPNLKGCRYLRLALEMASDSPYLLDNLAGRLYPAIARRSGDTAANVERSMRYAIALICCRMDPEERVRLLPCRSMKPGNKLFLTSLLDALNRDDPLTFSYESR